MTPIEEAAAFEDYKTYEGEQHFLQKVKVVFLNRLKSFEQNGMQISALFFPVLYTAGQILVCYYIIQRATGETAHEMSPVLANAEKMMTTYIFTFYFVVFLILGTAC